ncbi:MULTISPECIES: hypothetical protein [unclassified Streptomyces]|uniref:Uncharacterized protein n=1 Tax=Streptomyces sp. NBC_00060 TaxID=2975636 RepID=A0AAU2GRB2_9ACTN
MPLGLDQNVHVTNHLNQDIHVMPTLDKGWLLADVLADTALFAIGVGEIATATGLALPAELATFADLAQFLKATAGLLSGTAATGTRSAEVALELVEAFKKGAIKVPAGESVNVREQGFLSTYFKPTSGWFGMADFTTVDLTVMTQDGKRTADVDSSPDQSWIADETGISRAVYGTLNQVDTNSAAVAWN